jgi:hypothetical protein
MGKARRKLRLVPVLTEKVVSCIQAGACERGASQAPAVAPND